MGTALIDLAFSRSMPVIELTISPSMMTPVPNSAAKVDGVEPREEATLNELGDSPPEDSGSNTGWVGRELSESVASSSPCRSGESWAQRAGFGGNALSRGDPL
jgi:hypothetical protein